MSHGLSFLGGVGLGAGLMYVLDPDMGRRRQSLLRDKMTSAAGRLDDAAGATARDVYHRAQGVAAEARSWFRHEDVPDHILEERVRSRMGRYVSHPGAIEVTARDGRVTLHGPVLAHEVDNLLDCVASVRGVRGVDDRLAVHRQPGDVPGLQGGRGRPGERYELLQDNWSPAIRLAVGALGGTLFSCGLTRQFPVACVLGTVGLGLMARAATNTSLPRLVGAGGGRRAVTVHKTVTFDAPVEEVFRFWARFANFPRFMAHLYEVRDLGDGRSHWVAAGPGGLPVRWNAVVTRFEPNELLAWRSEPGSTIANAGFVRFEPAGDYRTRVDIHLCYNPPGGVLGHFAASLFGADARSAMDEDLVRLKSLLEQGKASAPDKEASREDLIGTGQTATRPAAPAVDVAGP